MVSNAGRKRQNALTDSGLGVARLDLCLDFVNTEGQERNGPPDHLEEPALFLEWAARREALSPDGQRLFAGASSAARTRFLSRARELREALYRLVGAAIREDEPEPADSGLLERRLAHALGKLRLRSERGHYRWELGEKRRRLDDLLCPVVLSAADLLRSPRLDRVKECRSDTCSWMFIDESRNRSRRWCDMADCGNRAKAKRFYRRHSQAD